MSISTSLFHLPLSRLEDFDRAGVILDSDLAALGPDRYRLDQGLSYPMRQHPDVFAYIVKEEGRIQHEHHPDVSVGYVTPPKLKERLKDFDQLDLTFILQILAEDREDEEAELSREHLENNLDRLREYLRKAAAKDSALLIVES